MALPSRPDAGSTPRLLLALEGPAATKPSVQTVLGRLTESGYRIVRPPIERVIGRAPAPSLVLVVHAAGERDATLAVRAALAGFGLVVVAAADRRTMDRLYDDLGRFGRLEVRSRVPEDPADALDEEERGLLRLLSRGLTLGDAATALHLSRRTADRRLAAARQKLHAGTTMEALTRFGSKE